VTLQYGDQASRLYYVATLGTKAGSLLSLLANEDFYQVAGLL
jgi:hypothetical protein